MRCWIICFFLALNAFAYPNIGVSGEDGLQYRHDTLNNAYIENSLQRRGNKKKAQGGGGVSRDNGSPPTSSTKSQGKKASQSSFSPPPPASPKNLFALASNQPASSSPQYQTAKLPLASPPRPPFTFPSGDPGPSAQASQRKRSGSNSAAKSKEPKLLTDTESALASLRVTQGSGATQTSSDIEASPRTPAGRSPISPQAQPIPEKRPTSPVGNSPSSRGSPSPPPRLQSPQRQRPDTTHLIEPGVPIARGIGWLPDHISVVNSWKKMAAAEERIQAVLAETVGKVRNDVSLTKNARRLDRQHLREARTAMSNGKALDEDVMAAVQKSKESTKKAQGLTFGLWNSHGEAADILSDAGKYTEGLKHFQKAARALARQELIMQRGQAFDYKFVNQGVKEGLNNLSEKGIPPHTGSIQRAVAMRRAYKDAAEGYHKAWRDYQTVRDEFSGSSSDESEKSTFDDIVPKRNTPA